MSVLQTSKINSCLECPFYERPAVWGTGKATAAVMIVGDYPREEDAYANEPFSGFVADRLDAVLKKVDISRDDVYLTNAVKCVPPNNVKSTSKDMNKALEYCRPLMEKEIERLGPEVIVLGGEVPLKSVLQLTKIGTHRGVFHQRGDSVVMPTNSLMAILHNPRLSSVIEGDFKSVGQKIDGKVSKITPTEYILCDTVAKVKKWTSFLAKQKYVSFDVETTCWDTINQKVRIKGGALLYTQYEIMLLQFGYRKGKAILIPLEKYKKLPMFTWTKKKIVIGAIRELFNQSNVTWVIQDIMMDLRAVFKLCKIDYERLKFHDIQLIQHILNENEPADLDYMASVYTDMKNYKQEINKKYDYLR